MISWAIIHKIFSDSEIIIVDIEEFKDKGRILCKAACIKSNWGEKVINQLDKYVDKKKLLNLRGYVGRWMPNKKVRKEFIKLSTEKTGF